MAVAIATRLVHPRQPIAGPEPDAAFDYPSSQRFHAQAQTVRLSELPGSQGRAKVGVALAHQVQHRAPEGVAMLVLLGRPRLREIARRSGGL